MSPISRADVEVVMSRALGPHFQLLDYHVEPFGQFKNGCLGLHYSVKIEAKRDNIIEIRSFFLKTRCKETHFLMDDCVYEAELQYYGTLQPLMEACQGERWSPKCYLVNDMIVLENLKAQGFCMPKSNLLSQDQLRSTLTSLANFHAASILLEQRLGRPLADVYPDVLCEKYFTDQTNFGRTIPVGMDTVRQMANIFGLDSSLVPRIYQLAYQLVRPVKSCNAICHGDLWMNNLLFDTSYPARCFFVDYQFIRYASPCVDVAMLLYLHTTPSQRRQSEMELFRFYHSKLHEVIKLNDGKAPDYEQLLRDYRGRRLLGMLFASLYEPALYLKPERLAEIMNNPDQLENWFFHNRIDVIKGNMAEDPEYRVKMKDMVQELLEEGARMLNK